MKKLNDVEMDSLVKESIRECLKINTQFKPTDTLVMTTYNIMKTMFVDKIDYVFLEAPTGSGKSVISYLTHFCYTYIKNKLNGNEAISSDGKLIGIPAQTYIITSSKMLQEQIDGDISRFSLDDYLTLIKGVKNYECTKMTKDTGIYHTFSERYCMGQKTESMQQLPCYDTCPYIQKRFTASAKDCTILNYSYFLNALKLKHNIYFGPRDLTIADEAHLIPDIVLDMYNISLTMYKALQIQKMVNQMSMNFKAVGNDVYELKIILGKVFDIFLLPKPTLNDFINHTESIKEMIKGIVDIQVKMANDKVFQEMFTKDINKLKEDIKNYDYSDYFESLKKREEDVFIKTELIGNNPLDEVGHIKHGSYKIYKHNLYDLSESELCREHFIGKLKQCVFMSATLGNIEEFAHLMGLKEGEYAGFRLGSNFDFSKSPIHLVKSGYLNYNNFAKNIDKVLLDTLRLTEHYHPKEKGIIHTSTFQIASLLKDKIYQRQGGVTNPKRYLFYETSEEKEACIELMKENTNIPYIIVGPSLYEGIDLKQDSGRFNIIIKTPYSGIDDYIRKKMELYPFWYERQTLEKIVQAIGRTNREIDDWSVTYIMDSTIEKIIFKMPSFMTERISYLKIN